MDAATDRVRCLVGAALRGADAIRRSTNKVKGMPPHLDLSCMLLDCATELYTARCYIGVSSVQRFRTIFTCVPARATAGALTAAMEHRGKGVRQQAAEALRVGTTILAANIGAIAGAAVGAQLCPCLPLPFFIAPRGGTTRGDPFSALLQCWVFTGIRCCCRCAVGCGGLWMLALVDVVPVRGTIILC